MGFRLSVPRREGLRLQSPGCIEVSARTWPDFHAVFSRHKVLRPPCAIICRCAAKSSALELCTTKVRSTKYRARQIGAAQVSSDQGSVLKVSLRQLRASQRAPGQLGSDQRSAIKTRMVKDHAPKIDVGEIKRLVIIKRCRPLYSTVCDGFQPSLA